MLGCCSFLVNKFEVDHQCILLNFKVDLPQSSLIISQLCVFPSGGNTWRKDGYCLPIAPGAAWNGSLKVTLTVQGSH